MLFARSFEHVRCDCPFDSLQESSWGTLSHATIAPLALVSGSIYTLGLPFVRDEKERSEKQGETEDIRPCKMRESWVFVFQWYVGLGLNLSYGNNPHHCSDLFTFSSCIHTRSCMPFYEFRVIVSLLWCWFNSCLPA